MAGDRIERDVLIEAPIDVVWEVISRPEQIVHWFGDEAQLDLRPGGEGVLTFEMKAANQPAAYHLRFEAVEPPRRLAYRWVYPRGEEPRPENSMLVEFTLAGRAARRGLRWSKAASTSCRGPTTRSRATPTAMARVGHSTSSD